MRAGGEPAGNAKEGQLPSHGESGLETGFVHEEIRKDSLSGGYREKRQKQKSMSREPFACSFGWLQGRL